MRRETASVTTPVVRVAQVVRAPGVDRGAVIVEALDVRVRITVEAGAPAETVATVLGIVLPRGAS